MIMLHIYDSSRGRNMKIRVISLLIFSILLCNTIRVDSHSDIQNSVEFDSNPQEDLIHLNYEDYYPIEIWDDGELEHESSSGDGSAEDPYILGGWNITVNDAFGIFIHDTTKFFVIQNCWIKGTTIAIQIEDVGVGTANITNNVCIDGFIGILVMNSLNVNVSNNICNFNDHAGIALDNTGKSFVINNTCNFNVDAGIGISQVVESSIINNTCNYNSDGPGITVYDCDWYTDFIDNKCIGNNENGMEIMAGRYSNILNNSCYDNQQLGIYFESQWDSVITGNNLTNNNLYGITMMSGSNTNKIHHNYFYYNNLGGTSQANDDSSGNVWYDTGTSEGNYWKNWYNGSYPIDGTAGKIDIYPLDLDPPVIDRVVDIEYIYNSTGNLIQWNITDLNPSMYFVYRDLEEILSGSWVNYIPIIVDIDGLSVGTYIYQLFVIDGKGRSSLDSVKVTVVAIIKEFNIESLKIIYLLTLIIPIYLFKRKRKA